MIVPSAFRRGLVIAAALSLSADCFALPPGFSQVKVASGWNEAVGLTFSDDGRMFVWEKGGRVWNVENGIKAPQPLIDIHDEVGNWRDFGLLGFCVDPEFHHNGYIYLLYVVDYEHLKYYGTNDYDPNADWYYRDTIARLTRYTCNPGDGFRSVDYSSRKVLIGESASTGFPMCHQSHGIGTVLFGEDGSLLVGCGDGASYEEVDNGGPRSGSSNTALADGIITAKEDVGAFRAQLVDSLSGKIVRIDPATGDGLPNNPFYDPAAPRAPRSRVWAMGLRNPYRWTVRPGSGDPHTGRPGTIYIGDVGWYTWEELNIAQGPGVNFGWPIYEGMDIFGPYRDAAPFNQDAPNPLFGQNGCAQFFRFRDLLTQDTLKTPSWPNPCDPGQQVPNTIPTFENTRPAIDWGHGGPSRVKTWTNGDATWALIGAPGGIPGPQFAGNCAIGGVWYTGDDFPPAYKNTYFAGDFGQTWIRNFVVDEADNPVEVRDFATEGQAGYLLSLGTSPTAGGLYYISFDNFGASNVWKVSYTGNLPPVVKASAVPTYGPVPLAVQFTGDESYDPENGALKFLWDFGDGATSTEADPSYVFDLPEDVTAQGSFIGRIFNLKPPHPVGGGNWDPEVMRDGDFPPVGSADSQRQYDTYHYGDQGNLDWIGYQFQEPLELRQITFQEGIHFYDGGWWDSLSVQYRDAGGVWKGVTHRTTTPAYPGNNGVNFEKFLITFDPVQTDAIRLLGNPGGSANFISVGELRIAATRKGPNTTPTRRDVTLTVTDPAGMKSSAGLVISLNNTPPVVNITSPVDGSRYTMKADTIVPLAADISDAEQGPGELACTWRTILHHNEHQHSEPPVHDCESQSRITPVGCGGETYFYEFRLTVADDAGLETTRSVFMYPDCCPADLNADGTLDLFDFLQFTNLFNAADPRADCDADGQFTLFDFLCFTNAFNQGCP